MDGIPFQTLFLLALIAAFSIWRSRGEIYFMAAFLAIVTEGVWSAKHLTSDRLLSALMISVAVTMGRIMIASTTDAVKTTRRC